MGVATHFFEISSLESQPKYWLQRLSEKKRERIILHRFLNNSPSQREKHTLIAELQRAKRASETPLAGEIGNLSSWENLVMTSAYERTPSLQTLGEEEGRLQVSLTGDLRNAIFSLFLLGNVMNFELNNVFQWLTSNKLTLNQSKSNFVI